ncbi:MAG: DsrE/DsrF/DrsH-like family protein [Candidatus Omnitrophica bacterium]|nr:DsrE/DsrF/DrsH-like family protein [Candidatus Omnitrophota bacterium]
MEKETKTNKTLIMFSNDLDKALAGFNIAIGAVSMGFNATIFFTFWGINILRKENFLPCKKGITDKIFALLMPRGPDKLILSKMHMMGMGTWMMKRVMKNKQVAMLPELIKLAQDSGVKFIACQMSMDMMGIKREELISGLDYSGVAKYLEEAGKADVNLFI